MMTLMEPFQDEETCRRLADEVNGLSEPARQRLWELLTCCRFCGADDPCYCAPVYDE